MIIIPSRLFSEYLPLRIYLQETNSITNNNVKKRFYVYKSQTGYTKYKCKQKSSFFWLPWSATHVTKYSHVLIVLKDIRNPAKSKDCGGGGGSGGGGVGGGLLGPHNRNFLPFPDVPLPGDRNMQRVRKIWILERFNCCWVCQWTWITVSADTFS